MIFSLSANVRMLYRKQLRVFPLFANYRHIRPITLRIIVESYLSLRIQFFCILASGFSGNFYLHTRVCGFNRSPIARAFGLTCIRIQGLVMLFFYTACFPASFGGYGADSPTRTDNRLITNQLRYRLRHICSYNWSEGRESNPQMLAWKARAKPLGYPRIKS